MIFRIFLIIFLIFPAIKSNAETIGIVCDNSNIKYLLKNALIKNHKITDNFKIANILICGGIKNIHKCLKYNKKVIAINIHTYQIEKIRDNRIIAYFPVDFKIKDIVQFISSNLNLKRKCILTHYFKNKINNNDLKIYGVKSIGEVPYILDKAIRNCDIIISIPDDIVFNYFSTRFIFKKVIINGKLITGFNKTMTELGAAYSFELDNEKYVNDIVSFIKKFKNKKVKSQKIFFQKLANFKVYKNSSIFKMVNLKK